MKINQKIKYNLLFINKTQSTNELLWDKIHKESVEEGFILFTDFQTAGKGHAGNNWESENGKNLLFSMALFPHQIPVDEQFIISQIVCLSIKKTLDDYIADVTIKWPNDIYWKDKKLGGILIENSLQGSKIKSTVIGIGLNVNQKQFISNAPNPISLLQITGKSIPRKKLLNSIRTNILELYYQLDILQIQSDYHASLYRNTGYNNYWDENGVFKAKILSVRSDGKLELETEAGGRKGYYFKEVQFVL